MVVSIRLDRLKSGRYGRIPACAGRIGVPGAIAALLCVAAPAMGVEPNGVEEVVVTARHRTEKAQKVPISLTSVGEAKLEATGTTAVNQLQNLVPSLQIAEFNPRNTSFNIRGVGSNVATAVDGLEAGVGVYVDGVLYPRPGTTSFSLPDLENVQVLRGPQGTLFGKNTTAGAIDVHTSPPSFDRSAYLEASYGNYNFWQVKGSVTDALTDKVAARVSFLADQRDGDITSLYSGQHYNTLDDKAVRIQLLAQPTDDLKLRLITDYSHQLENCCVYFPIGYFTHLTGDGGSNIAYTYPDRLAALGYQIPPGYDPFSRKALINADEYYEMENGGVSLQGDYDLNGFTLTSISAWRFWDWYPHNLALNLVPRDIYYDNTQGDWQRQASQEFRITSPTGGPVDYTAGLYYFYQDMPGPGLLSLGPDFPIYTVSPKPPALDDLAYIGRNVVSRSDPVTSSYATYGQSTWHVLPKLDLTGGLRYTYEDKSGSYDQTQTGGASLAGLPASEVAAINTLRNGLGPPLYYDAHAHNGSLSYIASATYKFTDSILAYATYSRGNKSEGINVTNLPATTVNGVTTLKVDPVVKPERIDDYEIGFKSVTFDNRLIFNADVFWVEDSDYQGITVAPLTATTYVSYISSVPKVQARGFELDTNARPLPWLTLNFSSAYTDGIYESYPAAQCPPEVFGAKTKLCNLTGAPIPGTSRWVTSMGGQITQPLGSFKKYDVIGYVGADFSLRSAFNDTANDSIYGIVPGYGLLDVRLGAKTADGKYDLYIWSHNATNTRYYQVVQTAGPFSGAVEGILGDPVTFGVTLKVRL